MHLAIQIVKSITLAGIIKLVVLLLSNLSCKLLEILVLLKKKIHSRTYKLLILENHILNPWGSGNPQLGTAVLA